MKKEGFDILATGEVLGQRPFSQNKDSLAKVAILAGVDVLRPLSAKLLDETMYEKERLVNRGRLHRLKGRTRDGQMELVNKYGLSDFPSPAGGCLLTDPEFSNRFLKMLDNWPECNHNDIELLKNGRVMWLDNGDPKKIIAVIGRNKEDNEKLEKLVQKGDIMLQLREINGPSTLIRGINNCVDKIINVVAPLKYSQIDLNASNDAQIIKQLATVTAYYAVKARGEKTIVDVKSI